MRAASVSRRTAETDVAVSHRPRRHRQGRDRDRGRLPRPHARAVRPPRAVRHHREGDGRPARRPPPHDRGYRHRPRPGLPQALGDKKGITRYADIHLPMDETLTASRSTSRAGPSWSSGPTFPTREDRRLRHRAGARILPGLRHAIAGITLHVETLYGDNSHHIAESCFKGLARALRRPWRSTRARRAAFPPPRARSRVHVRDADPAGQRLDAVTGQGLRKRR